MAPLREAARLLEHVSTVSGRDGWTLAEARAAIVAARAARAADEKFSARAKRDGDFLGVLYAGRSTDRTTLVKATAWIQRLREGCMLEKGPSLPRRPGFSIRRFRTAHWRRPRSPGTAPAPGWSGGSTRSGGVSCAWPCP
ncbi:hypothetical protein H4K36_01035 [Streptomyces sp. DHE7-1]|nr:hypothetical protein [Streptomyces sp. DHE7-1]